MDYPHPARHRPGAALNEAPTTDVATVTEKKRKPIRLMRCKRTSDFERDAWRREASALGTLPTSYPGRRFWPKPAFFAIADRAAA